MGVEEPHHEAHHIRPLHSDLLASAPALAHRHDADHARFRDPEARAANQALENRDDALKRRMTFRVGAGEREQINDQRRDIRQLQKQLANGQSVNSYELARALGPSYAYFDENRHDPDRFDRDRPDRFDRHHDRDRYDRS
jgi:hypothetical protein